MRLLSLVAAAVILSACYQTNSSDGQTTRTNTLTGKTERLANGRWVPVAEPVATSTPSTRPDPAECERILRETENRFARDATLRVKGCL